MEGLGRLFDVVQVVAPVDINGTGATGNRIHMVNCSAVTFLVSLAAGAGATVIDLRQHTAATGGVSADLDVVDRAFSKSEVTLDGDETWTLLTQVAASEVTTGAALQELWAVSVDASQLADGYEWISVDLSDPAAAEVASVVGILHDLNVQRGPAQLANPNA